MPSSKLCDHRLAAAGIAAHRIDGDGIIRRQQTGIDQRPQQRDRAGRIAAGIGDFSRRPDLVGLIRREFRKAVGPVAARRETPSKHPAPWAPQRPCCRSARRSPSRPSSGRQRMTRSTSSISARLAAASLRFSSAMLFTVTSLCRSSRSRMPSPVVPDAPSTNTAGFGARRRSGPGLSAAGVGEGHGAFLPSASCVGTRVKS